jgi:hypothetical protein
MNCNCSLQYDMTIFIFETLQDMSHELDMSLLAQVPAQNVAGSQGSSGATDGSLVSQTQVSIYIFVAVV